MKLLAIDIGGLTQDILLFDASQTVENCVQMIMPSPTSNLARKIREATMAKQSLFFVGVNMGGGPSKRALTAHLKAGLAAYATPGAAETFDDDPEEVKKMGVQIVAENEAPRGADIVRIETRDLDLGAIKGALAAFEVEPRIDAVAVAVLDHGAAPRGVSDRVFRFQHLSKTIQKGGRLIGFAYLKDEIPAHLTRMKAVARSIDRDMPLLVMDTPVAAAIGAMEDREVARHAHRVIVNAGNFHTLAFHLQGDSIMGFFEHHTRLMNREKLDDMIVRLVKGELTHEEVFNSEGHGCLVIESSREQPFLTVTGPQRHIMEKSALNPYFAAPYGDMMLTGCFGLVRAFGMKSKKWRSEIERALGMP
ncbi:MAG: pyruvate formate lyase-activating protein [Chloroflexi bacterium]|nr:pyruvate formate lyase-activating protein [Chloroflexota bacterium]